MGTGLRCFAVVFAAAMIVVAAFGFSQYSELATSLTLLVAPALFYLMFVVYVFVSERRPRLAVPLIAFMTLVAAWQVAFLYYEDRHWSSLLTLAILIAYVAAVWFLFHHRRGSTSQTPLRNWRPPLTELLLVAGAALILVSLFTKTTSVMEGSGAGWTVLARKTHWITYHVSPVQDALDDKIVSLSHLYDTAGFVLYLVAVVTALATLALALRAGNPRRLQELSWTPRIAALSLLTTMWIFAETFWGWRFELHDSRAASLSATACWLAAILLGAYIAFLVAHASAGKRQLQSYVLFQVPLILFSVPIWPLYFGREHVNFPGLCFLQAGLFLISLVYLRLVAPAEPAFTGPQIEGI